jgi:hypothetical protein
VEEEEKSIQIIESAIGLREEKSAKKIMELIT